MHQGQQAGSKQAPIIVPEVSPKPPAVSCCYCHSFFLSCIQNILFFYVFLSFLMFSIFCLSFFLWCWCVKKRITDNIQLVGFSEFKTRHNELAKEVDQTYNNLLPTHPGIRGHLQNVQLEDKFHSAHVRANPPERKKYKLLDQLMTDQNPPLQGNSRFPVSDDDIINYSAIVELAHNAQHKK
jgi:hypothetical protein